MIDFLIAAGILACGFLAVRENRLLISALWLALTSALTAWLMYRLGAAEVAVVELSVGAGLVTVLFVFAINITAGDGRESPIPLPRPLAWIAVVVTGLLLAWLLLPVLQLDQYTAALEQASPLNSALQNVIWHERSADFVLQVVLIFSAVLAVLGLIGKQTTDKDEEEVL